MDGPSVVEALVSLARAVGFAHTMELAHVDWS